MEYRESLNYYFRNGKSSDSHASFKISKPTMMKSNLENKKLRIQKFYLNNLATPIFIPDRTTDANYFNVATNGLSDVFINNTLTSNSLRYFINIRDLANQCVTVFLDHQLINFGTTQPVQVVYDDYQYYTNPYYYYYDFTHFLELIVNAINLGVTSHPGFVANPLNPILWLTQNGYFQLFVQNEADWSIEFSESLINLLPFKNVQYTNDLFRLVFDGTEATINGQTYNEVDANFYDTIYPFTQLIFRSDDANITPINFIDEGALTTNAQNGVFESSILTYDISTNNFPAVYNFYKYVNENDSLWVNFYTDEDSKNHLTIGIYLRLKNNIVIPYLLRPKELCSFTLEMKYNN